MPTSELPAFTRSTSRLGRRKAAERARYDASATPTGHDGQRGSSTMNPALRAPYRAVEKLLADATVGQLVLDYGSGLGIHSVFAARNGARVVGVDLSPRSTTIARETSCRGGVADRCQFIVGDCERLPFPIRTFDIVMSLGSLSSLRHDVAFAELARVVKPEGRVILVDTLGHNPLLNLNRRVLHWRGRRTRWELDHIPTLKSLALARASFREVRVEFFGLTTPLLVPLCRGEGAFSTWLARLGEAIDRAAFQIRPLRRFAFKFVCTLSGPER
jgi:ubiquinone/menaquinone biosynthesis C-methylase UbiE